LLLSLPRFQQKQKGEEGRRERLGDVEKQGTRGEREMEVQKKRSYSKREREGAKQRKRWE